MHIIEVSYRQNITTNMTREELIIIIDRIQEADGGQNELNAMVNVFLNNVPDPEALNYLSQKEYDHLSSTEIVDIALAYKPTLL